MHLQPSHRLQLCCQAWLRCLPCMCLFIRLPLSYPSLLPPALPAHPSATDVSAHHSISPAHLPCLAHSLLLAFLPLHPHRLLQVDHELSVPAVTMILLSVLAMAVAVSSNQLIASGLTRQARAALVAAGPLGTVVTEAAVHGLSSPIAFVAAIACSLAGVLLRVTAVAPS